MRGRFTLEGLFKFIWGGGGGGGGADVKLLELI